MSSINIGPIHYGRPINQTLTPKIVARWEHLKRKEIKNDYDPDLHDTLYEYASRCDHVTEFGVRWVESTFSFILGQPSTLISIDIDHPNSYPEFNGRENLELAYECAEECGVDFTFKLGSTLGVDIDPTDLLFIDTEHSYLQLKHELKLHSSKVKKYILMHDTLAHAYTDSVSHLKRSGTKSRCGNLGLRPIPERHGLRLCIEEFLEKNKGWVLDKIIYTGKPGMTILKRI